MHVSRHNNIPAKLHFNHILQHVRHIKPIIQPKKQQTTIKYTPNDSLFKKH